MLCARGFAQDAAPVVSITAPLDQSYTGNASVLQVAVLFKSVKSPIGAIVLRRDGKEIERVANPGHLASGTNTFSLDVGKLSAGMSTAIQAIGEIPTVSGTVAIYSGVVHINAGMRPKRPTIIHVSEPIPEANFTVPDFIDIRANVKSGDGVVEKVEFFANDKKIGESSREPYQTRWEGATPGKYALKAVALLNTAETVSSAAIPITVHPTNAAVVIMSPANGSRAQHNVRPALMASFSGGNQVRLDSFRVLLDGHDFGSQAATGMNEIVFIPKFNLKEGRHTYALEWQSEGKVIAQDSTSFTVDSLLSDGTSTRFFGEVRNMDETPIAKVLVRAAGRQTFTGPDGRFSFNNLPAGEQTFSVDPSGQTTDKLQYAPMTVTSEVVAGHTIRRERPIFLSQVDRSNRPDVDQTTGAMVFPGQEHSGQPSISIANSQSAISPIPRPLLPTVFAWDSDTKSVDTVPGALTAHVDFAFQNVSKDVVVITGVHPSCGCTTAQVKPLPWTVAAGAKGQIGATVNLQGKSGTLFKSLAVTTNKGGKILNMQINIAPMVIPALSDADRARNLKIAVADRQAVFKSDCAACHANQGEGKFGKTLYEADCAICHEGAHRASMVPDLHALKSPMDKTSWLAWIAHGKSGSLMPAFSSADGGPLTADQIASLTAYLSSTVGPSPSNEASTGRK